MIVFTDIVTEVLFNLIPGHILHIIIASSYILILILYTFSMYIGIIWLVLGVICAKLGRLDSAKLCYTICVLFSILAIVIEVMGEIN